MQILIILIGFLLWFFAYESKPISNDEGTFSWEEENIVKRTKIINIMKDSF